MEQKLQVTNDLVFKQIFGKSGNENITKGLLEKVLGIKIEDLTLDTNRMLIGKMVDDKAGIVDVKAKLSDGTKVIIEMQVINYNYMIKRILYYWAQTYVNELKSGDSYETLDKTIVLLVSVENLNQTKETENYHTKWNLREKYERDIILTEDLEIHIIELNKFKEGKERPEDNWIKFIKGAKMDKLKKCEKEIEEAVKELEKLEADPLMRELYEMKQDAVRYKKALLASARVEGLTEGRREGLTEGKKEGKKQGIQEGIKQGMAEGMREGESKKEKEIVNNMYREKMNIEDICKFTNLTKEEVKKLIE